MAVFGFKKRSGADPSHGEAVEDCAAFLSGHLAERLLERRESVPVWAWINLLAHGTYEELLREIAGSQKRDWLRSRAYLAAEVVAVADGPGPLLVLQEAVLRPLELSFAASSDVRWWGPSQLARHVNAALAVHRAVEHHPSRTYPPGGRFSS
jgi:hypothetical protein